jgi:SPP1 family predicted phage head-tail adaptor
MVSRQYSRKVSIYKTTTVEDGFGGNTVTDVLIGCYWAEVKQISSFRNTSIGETVIKNNYSFKIRANAHIAPDVNNLSIVYRNQKYVVNNIEYDDELFRFVNITANGQGIN